MWMTPEKLNNIKYVLAVVDMSRSTYKELLPEAMELLSQIPKTEFHKADEAQEESMLDHIRAAKPGETICIAEYAFTLHVFSDALIEQKQAGVDVFVLVDLTWCRSHTEALEVIGDLQAAGIEVKHLASQCMHFKLIIIGHVYASGGSANLSFAAFHKNADYVVDVEGRSGGVASAKQP
ncbi:hypothetical protein PHYBOEH_007382 [Phytophthora boehmeriae]|uniref:Mitochondrial cardiolipin hydrolase n=1 Tax=Phytophthora boehmeriae TaxID=109152 RepID=A0A8T1W8R0_9STRA|nr:hypothetical protein PHYBOEH_007382 [Phytophthora boehmeriae]